MKGALLIIGCWMAFDGLLLATAAVIRMLTRAKVRRLEATVQALAWQLAQTTRHPSVPRQRFGSDGAQIIAFPANKGIS